MTREVVVAEVYNKFSGMRRHQNVAFGSIVLKKSLVLNRES